MSIYLLNVSIYKTLNREFSENASQQMIKIDAKFNKENETRGVNI